ncbi:putative motility protein [Oleomonas cavernae]|uniref:Putative motility protein n=1 Tax=Oleomonas cavernae TaxID=2320859 RepID=A0A418WTS5_9PROT|nr:putative motility protein [Oleomonas cavernae]RJF94660.1 putative motility protein [Oleomonas cavernae]
MIELATTVMAMKQYQTQSELSVAFARQNADFQRQTVAALIETLKTTPSPPPGMGSAVDVKV